MNDFLTPTLFFVAGISLFSAMSHLFIALSKKRETLHLLFGLASLMSFGFIVVRAAAYNAPGVEELIELRRLDVMFVCLFGLFYVGFIAAFSGFWSKYWLLLLLVLTVFLVFADFILPYGLQFSEKPELKYIELPWGETLVDMGVDTKNPWHVLFWVFIMSAFAYSFYSSYFLYRQGDKRRACISFTAILIFFLLSIVNALVNYNVINFYHTSDLGFTALVLMMNIDFIFARQKEKNRLYKILNHLPFSICVKDLSGKYIFYNRTFSESFSANDRGNNNMHDSFFFGREVSNILSFNDQKAIDTRSMVDSEIEIESENRMYFYHLLHFCIPGSGNSVAGTGCILIDVTQDRKHEEELQAIRDEVWFSDRVLSAGIIAKSLAHEISQPLSAILSNAQAGIRFISRGNAEKREIRDILQDVVSDGKRGATIVSGLRAMLQHKEVPTEIVSLDKCIKETLNFLHSELVQKNVSIEAYVDDSLTVRVNKTQIHQVVLNLIINVLNVQKAVPKDIRTVHIKSRKDHKQVVISISDSDTGNTEKTTPKVFKRVQVSEGNDREIGLGTCKTIVEAHGGRIWAAPNQEDGFTFSFSLPLIPQSGPTGGQR
jgi:signal transduction histidine kinase